jgi:2-(1,2-epoxy-1,2-dihydrophenyl)acetyl-CoA isomerase
MTEKLLTELRPSGVLLLTLNRPKQLNAIDKELEEAFLAALNSAVGDDQVRAVVVAGAGDRAFCSGYDVLEMTAWQSDRHRIENIRRCWAWWTISSFPKPLVTANHALTLGWGAITSVSADIRIGSPSTEFQFTAAPHGGANLTWNLPHLVGWSRALEYLMTSRRIPADEAKECGLLNRVVPKEQVKEEALRVADTIASYPPSGVLRIKRLIKEGLGRDQRSQLLVEMDEAQRWLAAGGGNVIAESYRDFIAEHGQR